MSKLFTFLENFDIENNIKIIDEKQNVLFEGQIGDVPQKISNQMSVVRGTVKNMGDLILIIAKKS
ncbi:MAG: hypothetical protein IJ682_01970 [Lachnospiraceae bacterium]|nr:hypothetical protein [Lachnospiraceae bacterium]